MAMLAYVISLIPSQLRILANFNPSVMKSITCVWPEDGAYRKRS